MRFDEGLDALLDALEFFGELVDHRLHAPTDGLGRGLREAVLLGGSQFDELSTAGDELVEIGLFVVRFGPGTGIHVVAEAGDDAGVDAIGLGQDAQSLGVIADLPRIDDRDQVPRLREFGGDGAFITSAGFEDDQAGARRRQLRKQSLAAGGRVVETVADALRGDMDIELVFGDVDADERGDVFHGGVPSLRMRARATRTPVPALAAVRALSKRPATILLTHGLSRRGGSEGDRSAAGRGGKACSAPLRRLSHRCLHLTL